MVGRAHNTRYLNLPPKIEKYLTFTVKQKNIMYFLQALALVLIFLRK